MAGPLSAPACVSGRLTLLQRGPWGAWKETGRVVVQGKCRGLLFSDFVSNAPLSQCGELAGSSLPARNLHQSHCVRAGSSCADCFAPVGIGWAAGLLRNWSDRWYFSTIVQIVPSLLPSQTCNRLSYRVEDHHRQLSPCAFLVQRKEWEHFR